MKNDLVICASNWTSFVASLKSNLKLGYASCTKTEFRNGFYTASLTQGTDEAYVAKLLNMTGDEKENCHELCSFLSSTYVPIPQSLVNEIKEITQKADENKAKEAVATTIKRTRQPRKEKK